MKFSFQTVFLIIFSVGLVVGVGIFSGVFDSKNKAPSTPEEILATPIVMWGTLPKATFGKAIEDFNIENKTAINYIQKNSQTFEQEFVEALASNKQPDILLLPDDLVVKQSSRLLEIPYETYPERTLRDTFVPISDIFRTSKGVVGFPLVVDPMVMYYNRTLFGNQNIVNPPKTWEELEADNLLLTKRDAEYFRIRGGYGGL